MSLAATSREIAASLRPGDGVVLLAGAALVGAAFAQFWQAAPVERAEIRQAGKLIAQYRLADGTPVRQVRVNGPLGETVIEIAGLRARVARDPGPRQLCVRQGWIDRAGAVALCAPNQVTLRLLASDRGVDSIHY